VLLLLLYLAVFAAISGLLTRSRDVTA